jgi:peroxiredoxin
MTDFITLPNDLPVPEDDGAARHLPGAAMPALTLTASDGSRVDLAALDREPPAAKPADREPGAAGASDREPGAAEASGAGRTAIYIYPLTGRPGVDLPGGWDEIPGARGCSTEACDFRDHFADLRAAGVARVFGLSSQEPDYQAEVVERLRLPFPMLSDPSFALAGALGLPTFAAEGHERLYKRLTLIVDGGRVEHVFYPVFPPDAHARQVLDWVRGR